MIRLIKCEFYGLFLLMMTLSLVFSLLAETASAGSYGGGSIGVEDRRRANVLLITMDDIGWDLLNTGFRHPLYSTMSTPNIQNLMDEGVTFLQGSAEAWCAPTRWELLTGLDTLTTGTDDGVSNIESGSRFDVDTPFLPQYLQATDYITYGSGKNGIVGSNVMELGQTLTGSTATWSGLDAPTQGWDHALMWPFSKQNNELWCGSLVMEVVNGAAAVDGTPPTNGQPYLGDCATTAVWQDLGYVNRAKDYLDDHYANFATNPHDAPPFFLWMSFLSPHVPVTRHPGVSIDLTDPASGLGGGGGVWVTNACTHLGPGGADSLMTPQDCLIAHVESIDTLIGTLLAHITPAQMADTLIILHGDNGTQPEFARDWTANAIADNTTNAACVSSNNGAGCTVDDLNLWINSCPTSGQPGSACYSRVTRSGKQTIDHTGSWVPFVVAGGQVSTANWGLTSNAPVSMKDINETILTEAIRGFTRTPGFVPIAGSANNILTALQDPLNPCSGTPNPCDAVSKFNVTAVNASPVLTPLDFTGRSVVDNEGFRYYEHADVMYNVITDQFQTTPLCTASSCAATVGANADKLTALKAELARFGDCSEPSSC